MVSTWSLFTPRISLLTATLILVAVQLVTGHFKEQAVIAMLKPNYVLVRSAHAAAAAAAAGMHPGVWLLNQQVCAHGSTGTHNFHTDLGA